MNYNAECCVCELERKQHEVIISSFWAAVGKAFDEELAPNSDILKLLFGNRQDENTSSPWRKMAIVPKSTKAYLRPDDSGEISYVLMVVRNVHCYPGVPSLFRTIFQKSKVRLHTSPMP